jgi:hypothetical protein
LRYEIERRKWRSRNETKWKRRSLYGEEEEGASGMKCEKSSWVRGRTEGKGRG